MLPIASNLAVQSSRELAQSALPTAPTLADPPPRPRRTTVRARARAAMFLRASARRRARLADRLDPACLSSVG